MSDSTFGKGAHESLKDVGEELSTKEQMSVPPPPSIPGWSQAGGLDPYKSPRNYNDYRINRQNLTASGIALFANRADRLRAGHLLVVFKERCYQVDPNSGDITYTFELHRSPASYWWMAVPAPDGTVYCSLSGSTSDVGPQQFATFGALGSVVRVNHIRDEISIVAEGGNVVDPFGLELHKDRLLVADFDSWGGTGKISQIHLLTGANEVLATGGEFVDPQMATLDEDGILWVANAMHRQYDGQVIKVKPKNNQTVIYPRHGPGSGIVSGIFPSNHPDKVLFVIIDWPFMAKSAVLSLEKTSGKVIPLLEATVDKPKLFNAHGVVHDDFLWIGESYNNEILGFDLKAKKIAKRIDISPILGTTKGHKVKGVPDSFDFLECIHIVPPQENVS